MLNTINVIKKIKYITTFTLLFETIYSHNSTNFDLLIFPDARAVNGMILKVKKVICL